MNQLRKIRRGAFTLVEILVSIAVLSLVVVLFAQLLNSATSVTGMSTSHLDDDDRVRLLFGRMASDLSRMVRRVDVDYYMKSSANPMTGGAGTGANDQMAFYSEVSGYSTVSDAQNSVALVAYRLNTSTGAPFIERMGKALSWNANSTGILPVVFEPLTIANTWPTAASPTSTDLDYETLVPNAFRFEYYYLLRSGTTSANPWDPSVGSTGMNGFKDVAAIGVAVAVTDRKTALRVPAASLITLAGNMADFSTTSTPTLGTLQASWQNTVSTSSLAPTIQSGIRVYEHLFTIDTPAQ